MDFIYNQLEMYVKNWKIFLISTVAVFLMTSLIHLGVRLPKLVHGLVTPEYNQSDMLEKIKPKLEEIKNDFTVNKVSGFVPEAVAAGDFDGARSYGVVDFESGDVIASKNLEEQVPIASLTKVMTAVVALDLLNPEDELVVSKKASRAEPTKVMLKPGEQVSLDLLLKSALLASANDSAQAIMDGIDDRLGQPVFLRAMNLKAENLGLKNTHFSNPQGLDIPGNYSSVEDLMVLSHYALKNYPEIAEIVDEEFEDLNQGDEERFYLNNWNGLVGVYPGVFGVKIGNTGEAKYTTIVGAEREGHKLLAVVLGAPGVLERDLWAAELLDLGFEKEANLAPIQVTEEQMKEKYASWKYPE